MPNWTDEQKRVIDARHISQMVSAAAGSGKTAVMTEYVTRLVMEGEAQADQLAVVTFTSAAASEMRERITRRLEQAVRETGSAALRAQAEKMEDAWISTFHAFCSKIITRYGAVSGLDPNLVPADEEQQASLWLDAQDEALETAFGAMDEDLRLLARGWGGRDGTNLGGLVTRVYRYVMARPEGTGLLDTMEAAYVRHAADPEHSPWKARLEKERAEMVRKALRQMDAAIDLALRHEAPEYIVSFLRQEKAGYERGEPPLPRYPTVKKADKDPVQAPYWAAVKVHRDLAKKLLEKKESEVCEDAETLTCMVPAIHALCALTRDAAARYAALKEERGLMDFNDMEHMALRILENDEVAEELRRGFKVVLVDEYQDTNRVQETILRRVSREDNLFTVGDVKQAIYGFRQADPTIFIERCALPEEETRHTVRMTGNFRSSPAVVDFVNEVFTHLMTVTRGGIDYTDAEKLVCRARRPETEEESTVRLLLVQPEPGEDGETEESPSWAQEPAAEEASSEDADSVNELVEMGRIERQARAAALWIRRRMGQPVFDGKAPEGENPVRTCRYSDFAILTRTRTGRSALFARTLEAEGIPAVAVGGGGWYDQEEVKQVLELLALLDNRNRDRELLSVMHSPMGRFTLKDLWAIRRTRRHMPFTEAAALAARDEGELAERVRRFLARLEGWRTDARVLNAESLLWKVLDESGYYDYLGTLPGGDVRQANLRLLMNRAAALAGTRHRGLYGLLQYLERVSGHSDSSLGVAAGDTSDTVKVTTIHGSKGLEYPIVILADANHKFNMMDTHADAFLMDEEMGFGMRALTEDRDRWQDTLCRRGMALAEKEKILSEEVRILYVALTRAREELAILAEGVGKDTMGPLDESLDMGGSTYMDWLSPILARCKGTEALYPDADHDLPPRVAVEYVWPEAPAETAERADLWNGRVDPELLADLTWEYPHTTDLPAKISVTELVVKSDEILTRRGAAGKYTAAERGTFTHKVLQRMTDDPENTAEKLAAGGLIPPDALPEIHYDWLRTWMDSPLAQRAAKALRVEREIPFNLRMTQREVFGRGSGDPVLVQGVIDLAFREEDGWVLVDYKTGDVLPGKEDAYLTRYAPQLALYTAALERLTGQRVKEAGLYILPRALFLNREDEHGNEK